MEESEKRERQHEKLACWTSWMTPIFMIIGSITSAVTIIKSLAGT